MKIKPQRTIEYSQRTAEKIISLCNSVSPLCNTVKTFFSKFCIFISTCIFHPFILYLIPQRPSASPLWPSVVKICLIVFLSINNLFAIPPVTVIVNMMPPYTPYLQEYSSMNTNRLQVSIIVNDATIQNYPVKLQMVLEQPGTTTILMQTNPYASIAPILLQGQTTEVIEGVDLSPYFLAQNITFSGIDQAQYIQTGRIPDGQYRLGFRVVDSRRTDVILSNTGYSAPGWFVLNDPPLLNLPRNIETVRVADPQSVLLEWFPRHLGSMNSAFATKYQVELFAIRIPGMNPEQLALSSLPTFTIETTTPRIYLKSTDFILEPGVQYAWRVKAYADEGITVFKNYGYSEVYSFIYGTACPAPLNPLAMDVGPEKATIGWDGDPLQTSFNLRFRLKGDNEAIWHDVESFQNSAVISNLLTPGTTYEYQVMAKCNISPSEYTAIKTFTTTNPMSKFFCGANDTVNITNRNPKQALVPGDFIYNGKFPLKLTEVSGSNGVFSGKGRMRIPMLNNIQVNMQFTGIKVNELNQIYEGELVSIFNPDSKFLLDAPDIKNIFPGNQDNSLLLSSADTSITINGTIQKVITQGNETLIITDKGDTIKVNSNDIVEVTDSKGNLTTVAQGAMVAGSVSGSSEPSSTHDKAKPEWIVRFSASPDQKYGFDAGNMPLADNEQITIAGQPYVIPWKSLATGKPDKVVPVTSNSNGFKGVVFRTQDGASQNYINSELQLSSALNQHLSALYMTKDTGNKVQPVETGKLNIVAYPPKPVRLTIVPVNGCAFPDNQKDATDSIKKAYAQAAVDCEIIFDEKGIQVPEISFDSAFNDDVCALCDYTSSMRSIWSSYKKANNGVISDMYYIFLVKNSKTGKTGYFPFAEQYGFVYVDKIKGSAAKSLAHELGHGAFRLEHYPQHPPTGSTPNLMDYGTGLAMIKMQWDWVQDPGWKLYVFKGEEEQSLIGDIIETIKNANTMLLTEAYIDKGLLLKGSKSIALGNSVGTSTQINYTILKNDVKIFSKEYQVSKIANTSKSKVSFYPVSPAITAAVTFELPNEKVDDFIVYLGITELKITGDNVTFKDGNIVALIGNDLKIPKINIKLLAEVKTNTEFKISYQLKYKMHFDDSYSYQKRDGTTVTKHYIFDIPEVDKSEVVTSNTLSMDISLGNVLGGDFILNWSYGAISGTKNVLIRGENPQIPQIQAEAQKYTGEFWFFDKIVGHESANRQFQNKGIYAAIDFTKESYKITDHYKNQKGLPLFGPPAGLGLCQLDNWDGKICSAEQSWDWKKNIEGGVEVLRSKTNAKGNGDLKKHLDKINGKDNIEMDDFTIGNFTFTIGNNTNFFSSYDLKKIVTEGKLSFLDAALIQMYNGGSIIESITEYDDPPKENPETGVQEKIHHYKIIINSNYITDKEIRPYLFQILNPK